MMVLVLIYIFVGMLFVAFDAGRKSDKLNSLYRENGCWSFINELLPIITLTITWPLFIYATFKKGNYGNHE